MIDATTNVSPAVVVTPTVPTVRGNATVPAEYVAPGSIVLGGAEAIRANIFGPYYDGPNTNHRFNR